MASYESFTASVELWPGDFAPAKWAYCYGQILTISEYPALFSILGNFFGGNASTDFAVPDMRGRVPVGTGQGLYTSPYSLGEMGGTENMTLSIAHMPTHNHKATFTPASGPGTLEGTVALPVKTGFATGGNNPVDKYFGGSGGANIYYDDYTEDSTMAPIDVTISGHSGGGAVTIQNTGSSHPFSLVQPYTALNFIICLEGVYPPRS